MSVHGETLRPFFAGHADGRSVLLGQGHQAWRGVAGMRRHAAMLFSETERHDAFFRTERYMDAHPREHSQIQNDPLYLDPGGSEID